MKILIEEDFETESEARAWIGALPRVERWRREGYPVIPIVWENGTLRMSGRSETDREGNNQIVRGFHAVISSGHFTPPTLQKPGSGN